MGVQNKKLIIIALESFLVARATCSSCSGRPDIGAVTVSTVCSRSSEVASGFWI